MSKTSMDEIPCSVDGGSADMTPPPGPTIEEIREHLKPYHAKKFAGTSEQRHRRCFLFTAKWAHKLIQSGGILGSEGERIMPLELIG